MWLGKWKNLKYTTISRRTGSLKYSVVKYSWRLAICFIVYPSRTARLREAYLIDSDLCYALAGGESSMNLSKKRADSLSHTRLAYVIHDSRWRRHAVMLETSTSLCIEER